MQETGYAPQPLPQQPNPGLQLHDFNSQENIIQQDPPVQAEPTEAKGSMSKGTTIFLILGVVVVLAGVWTGRGLSQLTAAKTTDTSTFQGQKIQKVAGTDIQNGQIFGSTDEKAFKDSAEGFLEAGGDGEGTHKLLRAGGISQTVYLNSSVTDLDKFVGMNIKVWGETNKSQKAGWLMDVGRVQIVNTQGTAPPTK